MGRRASRASGRSSCRARTACAAPRSTRLDLRLRPRRGPQRPVPARPRLDETLARRPLAVLDELVAGGRPRPRRLGHAEPDDEIEMQRDQAYEPAGYDEHVQRVEAG